MPGSEISGMNKATNPESNIASRQTAGSENREGASAGRTPEQEQLLKKEDQRNDGSNEDPGAARTASFSGSKKRND